MCKTIEKITLWILFFQAHELMSPRELSQVFQVEDQDNVPEYEVVNIHHRRHKRDTDTSSVHQVTIIICIIKRNLFQLYFSLLHKNCNQQFWLSIHDQFQNIRLPCGSERDSLLISEEIILIASLYFYAYNLSLFQIALKAFGKRFELELNRNLNLVPEKKRLNVFFADQGRESEIQYNPTNLEVSKNLSMFNFPISDRGAYLSCLLWILL